MLADIKATVHIEDMSRRLIKNLSKGYRQRVGMAQAMIGYPNLIIMDEPTVGLDPKQIIEMRDVIRKLGKKHTIILSSHIMQEVSAVCDRVMIINRGRIVASDTPERLASSLSQGSRMSVRVKGEREKVLSALTGYPVIKEAKAVAGREPGSIDLELAGDEGMDIREAIFACMASNNLPILVMKSLDLSLEEIFLQVTGQSDGQASSREDVQSGGQAGSQTEGQADGEEEAS
jgi:ABC-2 type transport system ATP-binding protein